MIRLAVFKTGTHTDSKGSVSTWTEADLDKLVSSYDPKVHEAPAVIGHPKDDAPAYGWVKGLKREGDILFANVDPTVPEFIAWLQKGLYKKRSISVYPDGTLRHIGFLGAQPPAVKGLPDFTFNDPEAAVIEFASDVMPEDSNRASTFNVNLDSRLRGNDDKNFMEAAAKAAHEARSKTHGIAMKPDGHRTKPGKYSDVPDDEFGDPVNFRYPLDEEHIQQALSYWGMPKNREQYSKEEVHKITGRILAAAKKHGIQVDMSKWKPMMNFTDERSMPMTLWEELRDFLKGKGVKVDDEPQSFSEMDVKAAVAIAVEKAKADMDASFAERETAIKAREAEIAGRAEAARKKEVSEFCEGLKKKGVLTPAMEKMGMGVTSFMQAIAGIGETYEFAEAGEDGKKAAQTPLDFMRSFLSALPRAIEFREVATDKDAPEGGSMDDRRERLIVDYMDHHKGVEYADAMIAVSKQYPELFTLENRIKEGK